MSSPTPEMLRHVPLFADLEQGELAALANSCHDRSFGAGDVIAKSGSGGVGFFVIGEGTATVTVGDREVDKLDPGDYFGEVALIDDDHSRSATVTADTDLVTYGLTVWEFRPIVESNPKIAWKLLQALAGKLRDAEARVGAAS